MIHASVSVIALVNNVNESNVLINSLNCQSTSEYQLILMVKDKETYEQISSSKDRLRAKDYVIDYSESDTEILLRKALEHATGEYIWICESSDDTSYKFLGSMLTIQRNLGVDVVITDYKMYGVDSGYDSREKNVNDMTIYYNSSEFLSRIRTTDGQWLKFFRKSLIDDSESTTFRGLSNMVKKNATSICHYRSKMFTSHRYGRAQYENDSLGCAWDYRYDRLTKYYLMDEPTKIPITIGICAYNEQYVIEKTIRSIFTQKSESFEIKNIIVVSSGSTDDTNKIIDDLSKEFDILRPIYQAKREGKNSAVNEIMKNSETEIIVLYNADNVFVSEYSLDMLIRPFYSDKVGMTGGHPIPLNDSQSLSDYTVQLMWAVHHNVAMSMPNMGELIAFRNHRCQLPTNMQGDEGIIRSKLENDGYKIVYVPEATIFNKGPTNTREFIKQRKRVNVGELMMYREYGFQHPTHKSSVLAVAFLSSVKQIGYRPFKTVYAVSMEYFSRLLANIHVGDKKSDISIWEQIETTKKL